MNTVAGARFRLAVGVSHGAVKLDVDLSKIEQQSAQREGCWGMRISGIFIISFAGGAIVWALAIWKAVELIEIIGF